MIDQKPAVRSLTEYRVGAVCRTPHAVNPRHYMNAAEIEERIAESLRNDVVHLAKGLSVSKSEDERDTSYRVEAYIIPVDVMREVVHSEALRIAERILQLSPTA